MTGSATTPVAIPAPTEFVHRYVSEGLAALEAPQLAAGIARFAEILMEARRSRRLVLFFGNGASATTASHYVCDIGKAVHQGPGLRIRCVALNDSVTTTTAWANDTEYNDIFSEQLRTLALNGDVAVALSAGRPSQSIHRAMRLARERGLVTVGLLGPGDETLRALCDVAIVVPADRPEHVEDVHLLINHLLTAYLRDEVPIPGL